MTVTLDRHEDALALITGLGLLGKLPLPKSGETGFIRTVSHHHHATHWILACHFPGHGYVAYAWPKNKHPVAMMNHFLAELMRETGDGSQPTLYSQPPNEN